MLCPSDWKGLKEILSFINVNYWKTRERQLEDAELKRQSRDWSQPSH